MKTEQQNVNELSFEKPVLPVEQTQQILIDLIDILNDASTN
ncbi:hypothetical protein PGH26_11700 [Sporosarcina jeotgali]|uniref:Transposase n=1 Tax=Sporosarcina jeotgali TaxID=3020056 RepID=A0ABZ0KT28_9BACL|nr:hypothetical protein [Sporosarcina sp. B2O-1]WOV83541.1 hypothetical protein PGH26_11700 [Sporosarcina sp. B2O-1]